MGKTAKTSALARTRPLRPTKTRAKPARPARCPTPRTTKPAAKLTGEQHSGEQPAAPSRRAASGVKPPSQARRRPTPDLFISYTRVDKAWAEWIAWQLEDAGYATKLQ